VRRKPNGLRIGHDPSSPIPNEHRSPIWATSRSIARRGTAHDDGPLAGLRLHSDASSVCLRTSSCAADRVRLERRPFRHTISTW
jgi:hypothetical protein